MKRSTKGLLVVTAGNLANPILALVWAVFAVSTWMSWRESHSIVALLLFAVNTLFAVLFVVRRHSVSISEDPKDWMITGATILLAFSLRVVQSAVGLAAVSQSTQAVAVVIILISLIGLGRSFGLVPANRGVKTRGMYTYVRHPLYSGEILFYLGFLLGNFTVWNAFVFASIVAGLNLRAAAEERLLSKDQTYSQYLQRVRFRFLPGLY
jgi:protein-S-isoprenylcysteine O-methyltransferase Ste14